MILRNLDKRSILKQVEKQLICHYSSAAEAAADSKVEEFKALNLKHVKGQVIQKKQPRKLEILSPRSKQMAVDQDWGNVWPGPRSFHPATVPLPLRQGYVEKGAPPDKYANAELMKIPNFLHLTPPVIKRQCEALKQFCTPWPEGLDTEEKTISNFPIEVITSNYCQSSPTIRNPLSRIVTLKIKVSSLNFNERAKDKLLRLVGDRYDEATDILTIVTDRCPLRKQNYDYAMYLLTALYHESLKVEPWEQLKSEADMEYYDWNNNQSKKSVEEIFAKPADQIPNIKTYSEAVSNLMNEGENDYTLTKYGEAVKQLLNLSK
ncbi:28S ribosomal protein S35, mitochondrial [Aethina tumida]|uniref:28S ribosomal protein S35, mitochondrial n=1 Tax=Aethina tumida TaxID=116153 RepID=UPI002147D960|nr:28S ribosomal protein S35, mitochondrial [Aethina tumida]